MSGVVFIFHFIALVLEISAGLTFIIPLRLRVFSIPYVNKNDVLAARISPQTTGATYEYDPQQNSTIMRTIMAIRIVTITIMSINTKACIFEFLPLFGGGTQSQDFLF